MTGQAPRLVPQAAPVDSFITPAARARIPADINFEALARLSGTLSDYQSRKDDRDFQTAELITPDVAARLPKSLIPVLDANDPFTQENLDALQTAGLQGPIDNPYARLALRQSMAIQQVRDARLQDKLHKPEFFELAVRTWVQDPASGEKMLDAQVAEFIKGLGPQSPIAAQAAQSEVASTVESWKQARMQAAPKVADEMQTRADGTTIMTAIKSFSPVLYGSGDKETKDAAMRSLLKQLGDWRSANVKARGPATTDRTVLAALKPMAMELVKSEAENALHYLDLFRESFGEMTPETAQQFDEMERDVHYAVRDQDGSEKRKAQDMEIEIRYEIEADLANRPPMNSEQLKEYLFKGEGKNIFARMSVKHVTPEYELGSLRTDLLSRYNQEQERTTDHVLYQELYDAAVAGAPLFQASLYSARSQLTGPQWVQLQQTHKTATEDVLRAPDVAEASKTSSDSALGEFGDVANEFGNEFERVRLAGKAAWDAHIRANPKDWVGAHAARSAAIEKHPETETLRTNKKASSYYQFTQSQQYKDTVMSAVNTSLIELTKTQQAVAKASGGELDTLAIEDMKAELSGNIQDQMERRHAELNQQFRSMPALDRHGKIANILSREVGTMRKKAMADLSPSSPTASAPTMNSQERVKKQINMGGGLSSMEPERHTPVGKRPGGFWSASDGWTRASAGQRQLLTSLKSGTIDSSIPVMAFEAMVIEIAASKLVMDGAATNVNGTTEFDAALAGAPQYNRERLQAIEGAIYARGLSLQEIKNKKTIYGMALPKVFAKGLAGDEAEWVDNMPLQRIAMFDDLTELEKEEADMDRNGENSLLAQALATLGIDFKTAWPEIKQWQTDLLKSRKGVGPVRSIRAGFNTDFGTLRNPKLDTLPKWAQELRTRGSK